MWVSFGFNLCWIAVVTAANDVSVPYVGELRIQLLHHFYSIDLNIVSVPYVGELRIQS